MKIPSLKELSEKWYEKLNKNASSEPYEVKLQRAFNGAVTDGYNVGMAIALHTLFEKLKDIKKLKDKEDKEKAFETIIKDTMEVLTEKGSELKNE